MRYREFIVEYKRDVTVQKLGQKLSQAGNREGVTDVDKILSALEDIDPTSNKQYMIWLANQYIAGKFRLEDSPRIKEVLVNFGTLKSRLPEKDIGRYDLHTLEDVIDRAMGVELGSSDALTSGTFSIVPDSEILYNGPLGQLAVPKTREASCELGKGTKWCTAANTNNMFNQYATEGPLYIWKDKNGEKYQFHFGRRPQLMDSHDRTISDEKLKYFRTQHPILKQLFAREEPKISQNPPAAYYYAFYIIKGRWPEAEPAIAQDPFIAYYYARDLIKGRWPEAEPAIAQDPLIAYNYAHSVIKDRWPEIESKIAKKSQAAYQYALYVIKGRWPEGERAIAKNPKTAFQYARDVIQGRWPKGEAAIARNLTYAEDYKEFLEDIGEL